MLVLPVLPSQLTPTVLTITALTIAATPCPHDAGPGGNQLPPPHLTPALWHLPQPRALAQEQPVERAAAQPCRGVGARVCGGVEAWIWGGGQGGWGWSEAPWRGGGGSLHGTAPQRESTGALLHSECGGHLSGEGRGGLCGGSPQSAGWNSPGPQLSACASGGVRARRPCASCPPRPPLLAMGAGRGGG